jgi:hypothetical protein
VKTLSIWVDSAKTAFSIFSGDPDEFMMDGAYSEGHAAESLRVATTATNGRRQSMRKLILMGVVLVLGLMLVLASVSVAAAGQPNQSCEDQPLRPGNSINAPGSAFNPDGISGTHYAGEQPQNSNNPHSVSQYDVACFEVSTHS